MEQSTINDRCPIMGVGMNRDMVVCTVDGSDLISDVYNCARCGGDHKALRFKHMQRPAMNDDGNGVHATHWASCPASGDPILMEQIFEVKRNDNQDSTNQGQ